MITYKTSPGTAGNSDIPDRYDDLPSHNIEVFQSENVQNILDAKSNDKDFVKIHYEIKKLKEAECQNLKELLGVQFFDKLKKSFEKSESQDIEEQVRKVNDALNNEDKWHSLMITEKNTIGLLGDETGAEKGSKYHALIRHINKSEKDDISGGTFGKGSSVYTYCSGLWIWFAYSILSKPWNNTKARFVGRGMVAPFIDRDENQSYGGPFWYAREEFEKDFIKGNPQQGLPFVNEEAHLQAEKFGIPHRKDEDNGTTYLIPVFWPEGIDPKQMTAETISSNLKLEIIKRWFIPIYNSELKCFIKIDGEQFETVIDKDELYKIPELKYKIEILDWYKTCDINDKRFKLKKLKIELPILTKPQQLKSETKFGKKIGSAKGTAQADLVIKVLQKDEKQFKGFIDEESSGTVNRVALIRNKGMVVNHYPYNNLKNKEELKIIAGENDFEGILFAGRMCKTTQSDDLINHLEMFLGYAENPAHNEWIHDKADKNRCHLKRFEDNSYAFSKIRNIFTQIQSAIAEFFPKDDKPPAKNEICSFWKKLYRLPSIGTDKSGQSNFSYETIEEGFDEDGRYFWRLKLTSTNAEKHVKLVFNHYLNSLEGPIRAASDYNDLGVPEFNELNVTEGEDVLTEIILSYDREKDKGISKEITIKTCPITGNNLFKNMDPVLEINDSLIE